MSEHFQLIDLVSQASAIRKRLEGKTDSEKLKWLSEHGAVDLLHNEYPDQNQCYRFTSRLGREALFYFNAGGLVFVGDHTTFTIEDGERTSPGPQ